MVRILITLVVALGMCGCQHIDKKVNETWPPLTSLDKQREAVERSHRELDSIQNPSVLISMRTADWIGKLESRIKDAVPEVSSIALTMGRQEVVGDIAFSGSFRLDNGHSISLGGEVRLHLAASAEAGRAVVGISFTQVRLSRALYGDFFNVPDNIVELVNIALKRWLNNINGSIKDYVVEFDTQFVQRFDPRDLSAGDKQIVGAVGRPIDVTTKIESSAILIDPSGIHVLGRMVVDSHAAAMRAVNALTGSGITQQSLNPEDLHALRAVCNDQPERWRNATGGAALLTACAKLDQMRASPSSVFAVQGDFDVRYAQLRERFVALSKSGFELDIGSGNDTVAGVSRAFVSQAINSVGSIAEFSIDYSYPNSRMPFDETLNTGPAPNLNCGNVSEDCRPDFTCPGLAGGKPMRCNYGCSGRDCPGDCGWDFGCHAWKPLCELEKAAQVLACEIGKGGCIAACMTEHLAKNAACEAIIAAKKLGCEINQAWLNAWQLQNIANVKGDVAIDNAILHLRVGSYSANEPALAADSTLSTFTLRTEFSADADVSANVQYTPLDFGHILCIAQWSGTIRAKAYAPHQRVVLQGAIEALQMEEALQLWFSAASQDLTLKTSPSPVEALFRQNPHFAVVCAPLAILGATAQLFGELHALITGKQNSTNLLKDSFTYELKNVRTPIVIEPIRIVVPSGPSDPTGSTIKLIPALNPSAIVFKVKK